uniref:Haloacid dehalogenase-like hydrolase-like protein n=1 Tax=Angomonas deanei TaxID=59799 RepID=C6K3T1_9TRYP|nr:haloacid dehalogenase-like hydrolase-like protein [Angomonas deanei]
MPIKAVFSDMDGTLLNPQHQISDYTAGVLRALKEKGIRFILATGRPHVDVFSTIRQCKLEPDFIITSDGARIHDGSFNVVREHNIKPEVVEKLARIRVISDEKNADGQSEKKFATHIFYDPHCVTDRREAEFWSAFHKDYKFVDIGEKLHDLKEEDFQKVPQAIFYGQHEDLEPVRAHLETNFSADLCWTYSLPYLLNCAPAGVSKGNAMREVAELLGIELGEVAGFGDGMNDESMLQIAGKAFITSNAQQRLKDAVKHGEIIESNANDGVAKKLEELFLTD